MIQDVIQIFVWTCALGAAVAIPMSLRKSVFAVFGWFALYGLIYWHLTTNGRYAQDISAGSSRWMPAHCETVKIKEKREVPALNAMGIFFSPLVLVDRVVLHPPKEVRPPGAAVGTSGYTARLH
ncbi:MAG TPA: hypothetical protein VF773_06875 [Verrucomicrobiae bacterium]